MYIQIKPYASTLQMVDKISRILVGTVKVVLIQIDKFSFPVNFLLMDLKADPNMSVILGRQFMKTARMLVDIYKGEVKF